MDDFKIINNEAIYNGFKYSFNELPENVVFDGDISIWYNKLSILPNMSSWIIKGYFSCNNNKLSSLIGYPKEVHKMFNCSYNNLTSLKYCPKMVGGDFNCLFNIIETIDSYPEHIGGYFQFNNNMIKSIREGVVPIKYLVEFHRMGVANSKELLMRYTGCSSETELSSLITEMGQLETKWFMTGLYHKII